MDSHAKFSAYLFTPTRFTFFKRLKRNYSSATSPYKLLTFLFNRIKIVFGNGCITKPNLWLQSTVGIASRYGLIFFSATAGNKEEGHKAYKIHQVFHI